jgi:hypothetical protein
MADICGEVTELGLATPITLHQSQGDRLQALATSSCPIHDRTQQAQKELQMRAVSAAFGQVEQRHLQPTIG